ncbi:MAG: hypothetical protein AAFN80_07665, partial [Pseudomonadota bacterium]
MKDRAGTQGAYGICKGYAYMAEATARRRGRGGGGAARRAERTAVSIETAKYIERNIPNFEVLTVSAFCSMIS